MEIPEIATERCVLRAWSEADLPALAAILADSETMRFINDRIGLTTDQAADLLDDFMAEWEEDGFGHWAIEDRRGAEPELIGYCALLKDDKDVGEIDFVVERERWGRGFATEAVRAVLRYAFDTIRFKRVIGAVQPGNRAAQRVMEKNGMHHREDRIGAYGLKMNIFAITEIERRMMRAR